MKSGTGDDPFADEPEEESDEPQPEQEPELNPEQSEPAESSSETETPVTDGVEDTSTSSTTETDSGTSSGQIDSQDIPWVLRRDGVKDERPNMTQFFLQDTTDQAERGFQQDVENILNKDVYLLDLREAAYQVAMDHPEEVAAVLEEWGYDYL